jgi:hypothetical protein
MLKMRGGVGDELAARTECVDGWDVHCMFPLRMNFVSDSECISQGYWHQMNSVCILGNSFN